MSSYLVTLKPLEPYFFGGERTFSFGERANKEIVTYSNYFIKSEDLMSQTTLLGALRFLILKMNGKLNLPSSETIDLVGKASFSFERASQNFGKIESISPLFLINNKEQYYIKTPFNHKVNCHKRKELKKARNYKVKKHNLQSYDVRFENYTPFKIDCDSTLKTSLGAILLPLKSEFDPKEGAADSFMNLSTGKIYKGSLFKSHFQTGIKKTLSGNKEDQENSFFKKEYKMLNEKFKFAFFVEVDALPEKDVVVLGQGKSLFEFTSKKCNKYRHNFEDKIKDVLKDKLKSNESFYYAISDIFPSDAFYANKENKGFYIAKKKYFRNLNSDMSKSNYYETLKKSKLYTLLEAGSVFYFHCEKDLRNEDLEKIGFNKYVKIEGGKR